jgi:peptide/nickel transport system substrate-binding protein
MRNTHWPNRSLTRRRFLEVAGAAGVATSLVGWKSGHLQAGTAPPPNGAGGESPELAELVSSGELPPLEERLPVNPLVLEADEIGTYGGTWRTGLIGALDSHINTVAYRLGLTEVDYTSNKILPHVAESFEVNADGTEFTFKLRQGMKWSDGQPYTADDIIFWWQDVALNEELETEGPPTIMTVPVGGTNEPGTVEKIDDLTVRFSFPAPHGLFLIGWPTAAVSTSGLPSHYLKQFHKTYNPDGIDQLVSDAGADDWVALFKQQGGSLGEDSAYYNTELPTLAPWRLTTPYTGTETQVTAERNPYFWMVDREGNQLPYFDSIDFDMFQDAETLLLRALNGDIDWHARHFNTPNNKPVLAQEREAGDYDFFDITSTQNNSAAIFLNLTHNDPIKREIFNNRDFRVGLSQAVNRQEVIDLVFGGEGAPSQIAPRPESPDFYDEEMATQYTAYDIDLANQFLDQAGYSERDGDGFRLGPDGNRISFQVGVTPDAVAALVDVLELVTGYWREVGIDVQASSESEALFTERLEGNDHDAVIWPGDNGLGFGNIVSPYYYFPYQVNSKFCPLWAEWYNSGGVSGEEPPEAPRQQLDLYDQIKVTADPAEQTRLMNEILAIAREQFYHIGIQLPPSEYGIAKNNVHNVVSNFDRWRGQSERQIITMPLFFQG